jgi:hypothetical protein
VGLSSSLLVGGRLVYASVSNPTWKQDGDTFKASDADFGATTLTGIGPDVLYYTPSGLFAGATPMFTMLRDPSYPNGGSTYSYGGGIRLQAGKEIPVGEKVAVGVSLSLLASWNYHYENGSFGTLSGGWTTFGWSLGVSGTYH